MMWQWVALFFIVGVSVCSAQQPRDMPSARFSTDAYRVNANVDLPPYVPAPPGELTLFADFERASDVDGIPLYLVNRLPQAVEFGTQDGDSYLKLEVQLDSGEWVRAQAHQFSWCGNSYGQRALPPGMHYQMRGYYPRDGVSGRVRFTGYGSLRVKSNEGTGRYLLSDVSDASLDAMARRELPAMAVEWFSPLQDRSDMEVTQRVAGLRLAKSLGDYPLVRNAARKWLDELKAKPESTGQWRMLVAEVQELVDSPWPPPQGKSAVLQNCVSALGRVGTGDGTAEEGSEAGQPEWVWQVIRALAPLDWSARERSPAWEKVEPRDVPVWSAIMRAALDQSDVADSETRPLILQLLGFQDLVDECVPSDAMEALLRGDACWVSIAAETLSRRGKWEPLAELAKDLPVRSQAIILRALCFGPVPGMPGGLDGYGGFRPAGRDTFEAQFRQQFLEEHPAEAVCELRFGIEGGLDAIEAHMGPVLERSVRRVLAEEIERETTRKEEYPLDQSQHSLACAIEYLGRTNEDATVNVLRAFLKHRGYSESEGRTFEPRGESKNYIERRFSLRIAAVRALKNLGEPVPEEIMLERKIFPDDR